MVLMLLVAAANGIMAVLWLRQREYGWAALSLGMMLLPLTGVALEFGALGMAIIFAWGVVRVIRYIDQSIPPES